MLGNVGIILKINLIDHKMQIGDQWFEYDHKLNVNACMLGQSVQYSILGEKINHIELMMQKARELKGKIQSLNLTIPRISLHTNGELLHFYVTPKHYEFVKRQFRPGEFAQFTYNPTAFKLGNTTYYAIVSIKNDKEKDEEVLIHDREHDLNYHLEVLNKADYFAFLDLEFSMSGPEFRGLKFNPEIIQFGIIITDAKGKMMEKFSAYVRPTKFIELSGLTKEFLKITDTTLTYGISYLDFYNYIKEVIARYNPVFLVWGVSDSFILDNSYVLNDVVPLIEPNQLVDLQRIHRQYYKIGQDIGLYNAIRSYGLYEGTQIHDAIVDALVLQDIYFCFKAMVEGEVNYQFKDNYLSIMNNR